MSIQYSNNIYIKIFFLKEQNKEKNDSFLL